MSTVRFSASEIDVRRPLWIALSELYLDTAPDWDRVAGQCARSPFGIPDLQRILFDDVHPVVHTNLWSVTGGWQGFDEDWLVDAIVSRKRKPVSRLPWLEGRRYPWRELKPRIIALRRGDERVS